MGYSPWDHKELDTTEQLTLSQESFRASQVAPSVKEPACLPMQEIQEMRVLSLGQEDPLEEGMATHSSILARRIPWTEEPSRLESMASQKGCT